MVAKMDGRPGREGDRGFVALAARFRVWAWPVGILIGLAIGIPLFGSKGGVAFGVALGVAFAVALGATGKRAEADTEGGVGVTTGDGADGTNRG